MTPLNGLRYPPADGASGYRFLTDNHGHQKAWFDGRLLDV